MSSLRLALKQSLQDATPPLIANAANDTTATSSSGNTSGPTNSGVNTAPTKATHHHNHNNNIGSTSGGTNNPNHHPKKSNETNRTRVGNNDDHQSISSEENEASLNDLDDDDDSSVDEPAAQHLNHHVSHKTKTNITKVEHHHHQQQRNTHHKNTAAANRIQMQYRKTKKPSSSKALNTATTTTTGTTTSMMSSSQHHHPHTHPSPSRTKSSTDMNKKKRKKEKRTETKSSTTNHRTTGDAEDESRKETSVRKNLHHHYHDHRTDSDDHSDDNDDDDSTESSSSWTVTAPTESVIRHMASLSNETCIQNMVPGLRVKVLFDKPIRKWYGGYIEQIYDTTATTTSSATTTTNKDKIENPDTSSSVLPSPPARLLLRRIKIAYDDGTSEMTHFPDRKYNNPTTMNTSSNITAPPLLFEDAIVIDALQNGQHMTPTALEMAQLIYAPLSYSSSTLPSSSSLQEVLVAPNCQTLQQAGIMQEESKQPLFQDDGHRNTNAGINDDNDQEKKDLAIKMVEPSTQECIDALSKIPPKIINVADDDSNRRTPSTIVLSKAPPKGDNNLLSESTEKVSSIYHHPNEKLVHSEELIPNPTSIPQPSSISSLLQSQQLDAVQLQQHPASDVEDVKKCDVGEEVDDNYHEGSTIHSIDTNTATMTATATSTSTATDTIHHPTVALKESSELIIVTGTNIRTVEESKVAAAKNDVKSHSQHINESVREPPLESTAAVPVDEMQLQKDVEIEDSYNKSEVFVCDNAPKESDENIAIGPITEKELRQNDHELEATTNNHVHMDDNCVAQQASLMYVDDSSKDKKILCTESTMLLEQNREIGTSSTSDVHGNVLQLEREAIALPSQQMPSTDSGKDLFSAQNVENSSSKNVLECVDGRNKVSVDVATTEVMSTLSDVSVEKKAGEDVVDVKVELELYDGKTNENETILPLSTAVAGENVANNEMTPDAILAPLSQDTQDTMPEKVPPTAVDVLQLISSTKTPPSIELSISKNNMAATSNSSEKDIKDNGYKNESNDSDDRADEVSTGIVPISGNSDVSNAAKETTAKATTSTLTMCDKIPLREEEHKKLIPSTSETATIHTNRDNTDTSIDGILNVCIHKEISMDPMSVVDEKISESEPFENKQECLPKELAPSEPMPKQSIISSTIIESVSSAVNQIDAKDKDISDVLPPPQVVPTKLREAETAITKNDGQDESISSTNKLKRASPHTLPSQNDGPPKKKLTIRIPMHKIKQKPSNSDVVTTPKRIHIISSGHTKEVAETNINSSTPSQGGITSSKGDLTDTSELSPRQLKKLALKLERKRQKMNEQNNSRDHETSQAIVKDSTDTMLIDKPQKNDIGPSSTPTTEMQKSDDSWIRLEHKNAERRMDPSTKTSEEVTVKKKKKGVRRKPMEGDSDSKTSKDNESDLNDSQWVQCDECGKWRIIPTRIVQKLPKQWYCRDNIYDPKHSSCDAPEQTDKEVAKEKKRRLKKKQRLLKTAEEAAATASLSQKAGIITNDVTVANTVERSPRPPHDTLVDIEKTQKQQKRISSMEESQVPDLPLTATESRPQKKEKKLASTVKKGRSVESMEKLVSLSEDVVGAVAGNDAVKPRGRGRPRRANNATGSTTNTGAATESIPISSTSTSIPTPTAVDDGENVEWVQCEKCDKWRKLPPHVSANDLPDVWTCTMNTWNPSSASCDAPEDKSDGLQDIGVFGTNGSAAGKLTYRHLIFGSNGRKANRPISEKTCAAESIFSAHFDEDTAPTKVLYADSSAYISRGRPNISVDENEGMSVLELMNHSKLWQELRGLSASPSQQPVHPPNTTLFNNDTLRMNSYTFDTLPTDIQGPIKECVIRALDTDTLSGDEVVQRIQQPQSADATVTAISEKILPYCTTTVVVTTLCDLVKIGTVECIQKIGNMANCWHPYYRRKVQRVTPINDQQKHQPDLLGQHSIRSSSSDDVSLELREQRRRLSFPMKLSKPWKYAKIHE